jgi:thioredoxin
MAYRQIGTLAHWHIASLAHWLIGSLPRWHIGALAHCLIGSLAHCLTPPLQFESFGCKIRSSWWFLENGGDMSAILDTPIRTSAQNLDRVLATGQPMILVFATPECDPCRQIEPALRHLARDYAGRALLLLVEDAREGNLATRFGLTRLPTLVYWQNGSETTRIEGAVDDKTMRSYLDMMLAGSRPSPITGGGIAFGVNPSPSPRQSEQPTPSANGNSPVVVTDSTFQAQVLQSPLPVLVDFWAPWCGPCRMVSPIVEELGRQYAGRLRVAKVNTDENPIQASRLGIQGIPTLIFFKNGREVDRVVGAAPKAMLVNHLERALNA